MKWVLVWIFSFVISIALFGYKIKIEKGAIEIEWGLRYFLKNRREKKKQ